jgi:hypothetical protein
LDLGEAGRGQPSNKFARKLNLILLYEGGRILFKIEFANNPIDKAIPLNTKEAMRQRKRIKVIHEVMESIAGTTSRAIVTIKTGGVKNAIMRDRNTGSTTSCMAVN